MVSEIDVIDTRGDEKVVDIIKRHLKNSKEACFAVGYFSLFGWSSIKDDRQKNIIDARLRVNRWSREQS